MAAEFGGFVQEKQAVVGQAYFTWARYAAAADQRDVGGGVMGARNGATLSSPAAPGRSPATEWMAVVSSASSGVNGGRIPGTRRARMLLPDTGGPTNSRLCPPAAAISRALRASD